MSERAIDHELVKRAQAGDKKAFELLVVKYQRKIFRLLSRFLRNQAEVEDVAQETFIKAYRSLPQFRNESAFYTWLYRIAINSAQNYLQAKNTQPLAYDQLTTQDGETFSKIDTLTDGETPETHLVNKQIVATVNSVISELSEDLRKAIVLRELEGLSYEEIAQIMGCPVGTVRSRIFRAREAIAERLKLVINHEGSQRW